jgi:purine-binding chemotaxis protein CheW
LGGEHTEALFGLAPSGESLATEEDYEHGYARTVRGDLRQYVAFRVGEETYGLAIGEIGEISKPMETTLVPRTADFVLGIGNVRGSVIPVVDLARRLRLGSFVSSRATRVLIVRQQDELYGLVVDRVIGVVPIAPEDLEDAPEAIGGPKGEFISALARHDGELLIVLDLTELLRIRDFLDPSVQPVRSRA